ncbi:MAG TPA: cycloisomerase [Gammaproteobacteria bacterium]|nr:cycloisomerase [Gammaproteobacteria bacterium]
MIERRAILLSTAVLALGLGRRSRAAAAFERLAELRVPEANQGVGVDDRHFYAVDNRAIGKYDKAAGKLVKRWEAAADAPIEHLDGATVRNGKLYAAHSNYPGWPMTSSVEIFDASTLGHLESHAFGVRWGSLTWIDWHEGRWWLAFANYDQRIGPGGTPYGGKDNTVVIEMTEAFEPLRSWKLPKEVLDRFGEMSNSGGSWGPDGFLYLSGHDTAELYRMTVPAGGSALELVEIVPASIRGQGIAWDRSQPGVLYGIERATVAERAAGIGNRVTVSRMVEER